MSQSSPDAKVVESEGASTSERPRPCLANISGGVLFERCSRPARNESRVAGGELSRDTERGKATQGGWGSVARNMQKCWFWLLGTRPDRCCRRQDLWCTVEVATPVEVLVRPLWNHIHTRPSEPRS